MTDAVTEKDKNLKLKSRLFCAYAFLLVVYAAFVLLPAPPAATLAQYHLSTVGVRLIDLTIIVLLAGIWLAGLYAFMRIQSYASLIQKDKDGKQFALLAKGIFLLVIWLPVTSDVSAILNHLVASHPSWLATVMVVNNYMNLLLPLLGFTVIGMAARGLSELVKTRPRYAVTNALMLLNIYAGVVYFRLIATTPHRESVYHMSIWLILTTLVAPYVYMWSIGFRAAYDVIIYQRKVAGVVYKKSMRYLAVGIAWLIVTSIALQYLTAFSPRLVSLSIYWILALIYSLLAILSVGFILLAIGTRKLQKIEEV